MASALQIDALSGRHAHRAVESPERVARDLPSRTYLALLLAIALAATAARADDAPEPRAFSEADYEFFEKKVRPVLAENCVGCHGPRKQNAELRLDTIEGLTKGSDYGPVVVPGKPDESRLIVAIRYDDVDLMMPPKGKLKDEEIADVTKWIEMGAPWPPESAPSEAGADAEKEVFDLAARRAAHWAWQPIVPHEPPAVADAAWPSGEIDRFVLARLEAEGLRPAPEADRRALIRRASFVVAGLPPKPEEVAAFLADDSPDAFAKVVDRLLASPAFGERWARHWMDLVRYAESYGHEQDYPIEHAWQYRDYLIRAFNADVPYDDFVREHIAGDLLENPRRHPLLGHDESTIATGFWHFHQGTHAPVDVKQDQADRIDNMIDVYSKTFLGMTVSCARCHDHKFDAISTKDFYALYGILEGSRRQVALLDPAGAIARAETNLRELHERAKPEFAESLRAAAGEWKGRIAPYLLAAHEALGGEPKPGDGPEALRPPVAFDDFERDDWGRWRAEGVFGSGPLRDGAGGRADTTGHRGNGTGTLVSAPFVVERRYIRFRVGGAEDAASIAAELRIDGSDVSVRSATGTGRDVRREVWDVAEFAGKTARLVLRDASESGGIVFDDVEFAENPHGWPLARPVARVAEEFGLDAARLESWLHAILDPSAESVEHPLHVWNRIVRGAPRAAAEQGGRLASAVEKRVAHERTARANASEFEVFETFDGPNFGGWVATGAAFGEGPARADDWRITGHPAGRLSRRGVVHSGLTSDKFRGVLRSPTFKIPRRNIHYRVAGEGGRLRLVIEGYQIGDYNPLLFGDVRIDIETAGAWRWINQTRDMEKYVGLNAYIEIVDDGDGWVAVDEIRFSDGDPPAEDPATAIAQIEAAKFARAVGAGTDDAVVALAEAFERLAVEAANRWTETDAEPAGGAVVRHLLTRGLVDPGPMESRVVATVREAARLEANVRDPMRVVAMMDGPGVDERVFVRGGHKTLGDVVPRRFLEAISGPDQQPIGEGCGRLELAERTLSPDNPLPARVMVNRVWHHLFGRGIVASVDNFGALGEPPTHPELLDRLASRFRGEMDWSVKTLIREMLLSSAWRMSSRPIDPEAERLDPANKLLHRMNVRRLEGEAIRDSILAVSGRLDPKMFGEPVRIVVTPFMDGRNRPASGPLDGEGRRSVYMTMRRNFLSPTMLTFDLPTPDTTIGRRTVSNVPAQALALMNDPFVVAEARRWAERAIAESDAPGERIRRMYERALARPATEDELFRALAFVRAQAEALGLDPAEADDSVAPWADLAHALFMTKEFVLLG